MSPMEKTWNYEIEVCANSVESSVVAEKAGADRIELCENLVLGGTTPSMACVKLARKRIKIPIHVLVRPRYGDFMYSDLEFQQIKQEISDLKGLGVQGIVCGILNPDGTVDKDRTGILADLAKPLDFTFHRAIDFTSDPLKALDDIIDLGIGRVLTSGGKDDASLGSGLIRKFVERSAGRIAVMAGGGVNAGSIDSLAEAGVRDFHLSGSEFFDSAMTYRPKGLSLLGGKVEQYSYQVSSIEKLAKVMEKLSSR